MRILGWLVSAVGIIGVVICNGLAPLAWVLRSNLRARASDLLAVPDTGLGIAIAVTDSAADWLGEASSSIGVIHARADQLAAGPVTDEAAAGLAAAIDEFLKGPYGTLSTVYAGLRERALAVGDALQSMGRAVPVLSITTVVTDRLQAIDARMLEIETAMTTLGQMGPADLAQPGVAATVAARAAGAEEHIAVIGELVAEVEAWLHESRDRVAEADRRTGRALTLGAVAATAVAFFVAGLNLLLFQQGRRWSRR